MKKNKILVVGDCQGWAIHTLIRPLKKIGADLCFHYVDTSKGTGIEEENPTHLTVDLLKKYDTIHFNAARNVECMLRNPEVLNVIKNKRLIFTMHNERDYAKDDKFKIFETIICPTRAVEANFKSHGYNTKYIPYAIDEKKYSFTEDYPRKINVVGYIGRVTPHKRLDAIVEASKGYSVVGIGYVDNDGHEFLKNINKDNLTLYQQLSEDDKIEIIRNFTILVSVSKPNVETGPLGVLECAALGIPILTTNVGWAKDNLKNFKSCCIPDDLDILKDEIEYMMGDMSSKEYLRKNARKVIDNWTLDMYINAHKEVYESIYKIL